MLITYPHPALRQKARQIKKTDPELDKIIQRMRKIVEEKGGLGLAGNQIQVLKRIIIITTSPQNPEKGEYLPYLNPKIISRSPETQIDQEGCLSFPGQEVAIERSQKITVLAKNEKKHRVKIKAKDLLARVFQHEIDHLDGKLIIDYEKKSKSPSQTAK